METIPVCIIEKNYLVKEGLRHLLDKTNFRVVKTHPGIDEMESEERDDKQDFALVICGMDEMEKRPAEFINRIKKNHALSRIAVLSSETEADLIKLCFLEGADGYLSKNIPPASLLNALDMIMAGEKIYPAAALDFLFKRNDKSAHISNHNLSDRELEILKHVANGKTNKEIALHRNIAESTVKAHMKTILRKLDLSNRTQAARWAFEEGLSEEGLLNRQSML